MNQSSVRRSEELTDIASEYFTWKKFFLENMQDTFAVDENKDRILQHYHAGESEWNDWGWQLAHRFQTVSELQKVCMCSDRIAEEIREASKVYRWSITPYFLSQIRSFDHDDPIFRQSLPAAEELVPWGEADPMAEEFSNPAGAITRRYPDRLIVNITNSCPMYCRHCQRKRNIGEKDGHITSVQLEESIAYIRCHPEIRDVLITGGDALALTTESLERIVSQVRGIESVEVIRLGTRTLSTMPQRITSELIDMLKKYAPIYINTQFNHPHEVTEASARACNALADNGFLLGNQMVFLNRVNNDLFTVQLLNQLLIKNRVRPYYIFHPKKVMSTKHFQISLEEGMKIVKGLRGFTSGMCIPTYVYNSDKGMGKIPISPEGIASIDCGKEICMKTWQGEEIMIPKC